MFVTFFDTCMVSLAAMFVWRIRPYWVFFPWLTIACLDGTYLSSALTKVPNGAWFTITLAGVLASCFILWRFGKEQQWAAEAADRFPTSHLVRKREDGQLQLTERYGGGILGTIPCFGIFFDKAGETTPIVFSQWAIKIVAAPQVVVFFHLRPLETPSVAPESRYTVSRLGIPNCYRLIVRHGYNDEVITPDLASLIYEQVRSFVVQRGDGRGPLNPVTASVNTQRPQMEEGPVPDLSSGTVVKNAVSSAVDVSNTPPSKEYESNTEGESSGGEKNAKEEKSSANNSSAELAKLEEAYSHRVLYVIGKEQMKIKASAGFFRRVLLYAFLWVRDNTRTKIANLRVPADRVIEVGFVSKFSSSKCCIDVLQDSLSPFSLKSDPSEESFADECGIYRGHLNPEKAVEPVCFLSLLSRCNKLFCPIECAAL
jgi:KUP system potassium uptake protein